MEDSKALATRQNGMSVMEIASAAVKSNFFPDLKTAEQGVVKILRGRELGIGDMEALEGIHVIQGKTALSAALIGSRIKASGRYDYRIISLDDQGCEIAFYDGGKELQPRSVFTMDDAKAAGLEKKDIWQKYPRNMLMARALTNGARWHCPDVFGGAVYTPDELKNNIEIEELPAANVDRATGEIIEGEVVKPQTADEAKRTKAIAAIEEDWVARSAHEPEFGFMQRRLNSVKSFLAVTNQPAPGSDLDAWMAHADLNTLKEYGKHNRSKLQQAERDAEEAARLEEEAA